MINKDRILTEFFELVQITCNSRQEREIGDLMKKRLQDLGGEVIEDGAGAIIGGNCGNIIANFQGTLSDKPTIMLAAHLDCVVPCVGVKPILEALRVLKENNIPHGDLQIVFSVCEEGGLNGSKNIDSSLLKADFGYELDSSGRPGKIIVTAPGQNKINVKVHGKTAHAGLEPEKGINAIKAAGKILANVPQGRIDEETTCNIGIISGGLATNIVPDLVEIKCEARSRNQDKLDKLTNEMRQAFEQGAKENDVRVDVEISKAYNSYVIDAQSKVVVVAKEAAERVGLEVDIAGTGGGSDANHYNNYGIVCSALGVGMQNVHTCEEFIYEEDLYKTSEWVLEIIKGVSR